MYPTHLNFTRTIVIRYRQLMQHLKFSGYIRLSCALFCLLSAGCGEQVQIAEYEVPSENDHGLTSEVLRDQFPPVPFRWDVPQTWRIAANDQFSVRAWTTGDPADAARITVGRFPSASGIPAQVIRWRRQLEMESVDDETLMKDVTQLETKDRPGSFVSLHGERETIQALILPIEKDFWIIRYKSSLATAENEANAFRAFCQSVEYVDMTPDTPDETTSKPPSASTDDTLRNHPEG